MTTDCTYYSFSLMQQQTCFKTVVISITQAVKMKFIQGVVYHIQIRHTVILVNRRFFFIHIETRHIVSNWILGLVSLGAMYIYMTSFATLTQSAEYISTIFGLYG